MILQHVEFWGDGGMRKGLSVKAHEVFNVRFYKLDVRKSIFILLSSST